MRSFQNPMLESVRSEGHGITGIYKLGCGKVYAWGTWAEKVGMEYKNLNLRLRKW